jgi:CRISPR-associated protein Csh1
MVRELINFTGNLIEDIPDIMQWKVQPSKGLHVFIDIDENGQWINQNLQKGTDYDYYDGKSDLTQLLESTKIKIYYINSLLVNTDMNKCLDVDKCEVGGIVYPIKQIQSCSPYVVGFKRKEQEQEVEIVSGQKTKIKKDRFDVIVQRSKVYLSKASSVCSTDANKVKAFSERIDDIIPVIKSLNLKAGKKEIKADGLSKNDFIMIYIRNIPKDELERSYDNYLTNKLFLKNKYNSEENISNKTFGLSSYKIVDNEGKMFLKHLTGIQYEGVNSRISASDMKLLYKFILLSDKGVLPNPLPIFVDKEEVIGTLIKIFKEVEYQNFRYSEMIKKIFEKKTELQKYYLLNRQGGDIVDFDFVPTFRYYLDCKIDNCIELKDKNGDKKQAKTISNIFELEQIFNRLFVKYNNNTKQGFGFLIGNYFGNRNESQKSFKGHTVTKETLSSFYKYRKSIYDYIYKSRLQSITSNMFDDMVYSAILSDIIMDEKHSNYYSIREKVNIWFSLYDLFNDNNKNNKNMISKIEKLKEKIREVAENEKAHIESNEEFAFAAGQVVSHLLEKSEASNKTYAMLEPFLQKRESGLLQTAISKTIETYDHNLKFYNGHKYGFELLSADVLTYDETVKMEPLRKYFIAGCFSSSVFRKLDENNN